MIQPAPRSRTATAVFLSACALANATFADVIDTTWLGGTGSWNDPTKWSGGVVPNNTASDTFRVTINNGFGPSVNISPTVDALTIDNDSFARVDSGRLLRVGSLANSDGSITLNGNGRLNVLNPMLGANVGYVDGTGTFTVTNLDNTGNDLLPRCITIVNGLFKGGAFSTVPDRWVWAGNQAVLDGVSINGHIQYFSPATWWIADGKLQGNGTVTVTVGTMSTQASAGISIGTYLTVRGVGATLGDANKPFANYGHITGESVIAGNGIRNHGKIDGVAYFDGRYTREDLGRLNCSSCTIIGTMVNDGQTFRVDATTPRWILGGTLKGGTLETADGQVITTPYIFSGLNGGVYSSHLDGIVLNGASLSLGQAGSLTIDNGFLAGRGDIELATVVSEGPSRVSSGTATLTIDREITIHGGSNSTLDPAYIGFGSGIGSGASSGFRHITNMGTLRADTIAGSPSWETGEFAIIASTILNDGTIQIDAHSFAYAAKDTHFALDKDTAMQFGEHGVLDVEMAGVTNGGLLRVRGALDLSAVGDQLLLSSDQTLPFNTFYPVVVTSLGITGQFDSVSPNFEVEYRNGTEIWARFVPEPHATLVVSGITVIGRCRRRRPSIR